MICTSFSICYNANRDERLAKARTDIRSPKADEIYARGRRIQSDIAGVLDLWQRRLITHVNVDSVTVLCWSGESLPVNVHSRDGNERHF